ncbi:UNVERIFIED_CONTAM: hypothetical protein K2H54_047669 [Gekko kuhli]
MVTASLARKVGPAQPSLDVLELLDNSPGVAACFTTATAGRVIGEEAGQIGEGVRPLWGASWLRACMMDSSVNTGPILIVASGAVEQLRKSQAPLGLKRRSAVMA